ncbi:NAD(+)/NADH kinase [Candidatus Sumerlaeota bacterium]|nr:NAD(+)/NADH kinase [Candidatus Sumerlaeota bacterium]
MKVHIIGQDVANLRAAMEQTGIEIAPPDQADVMICHGGDGTLIGAERDFPGIPKVPIRNDHNCVKCPRHETQAILERLKSGALERSVLRKVQMRWKDHVKLAVNEVGLHMANPASATRFYLSVNGELYVPHEIIGDGLVVATPFGSTAYFRSITRGTFKAGLGLAIVNSVEPVEWAVLDVADRLSVQITRGPALLLADNDPEQWELHENDRLEIGMAEEPYTILGLDALRCKQCVVAGRPMD